MLVMDRETAGRGYRPRGGESGFQSSIDQHRTSRFSFFYSEIKSRTYEPRPFRMLVKLGKVLDEVFRSLGVLVVM